LFQVDPSRLARADFADLLEHEVADANRFRKLEKVIGHLRSADGGVVVLAASEAAARRDFGRVL
jgi:hypothetical protein